MQLEHSEQTRTWQQAVRAYVDTLLIPNEVEAELNGGELPASTMRKIQDAAMALGLPGMDAPSGQGGLGKSMVDQVAAWEVLGRATNALCWCFPEAQSWMYEACGDSDYQLENYIRPLLEGRRREAYAITEAESGSHEVINTTARSTGQGYRIDGEKWFVTSGNLADFFFLQARTDEGGDALFLVDKDSPGIEMVDNPLFSHTFPSHHPTYRFSNVEVPGRNRIGGPGSGMDYSRSWFRHERMTISARMLGAAERMIEEATEWARQRDIQGEKLIDKQAIQFMLADCATELWAARLMVYEAAAAHDNQEDLKKLHTRCSMVKLYATEMANRVADRCLQIWGGRGYRRDNAVERFFREVRVDRIWEGSSEIQRMIIAGALKKRGLEGM
ncbi:MAG: acyl-CoA dehydrogenase [Haliea sp.]|jgi:alkylation response protein AidB-like acyl-CoA dehydrogenase|nr:acyl-CoA dehydrogenase [Haliea sp.]